MQQFPNCPDHPNSEQELLWIKEDHAKLCCSQCLFHYFQRDSKVNLMQFIHLKMIYAKNERKNEEFISSVLAKNFCSESYQSFLVMLEFNNNFDSYIQKLLETHEIIKQIHQSIEKQITAVKNLQKQFREKLSQIMKLDELMKQVQQFSETQQQQNDASSSSLEASLYQIMRTNQQNSLQILGQFYDCNMKFQEQFIDLTQTNFSYIKCEIQKIQDNEVHLHQIILKALEIKQSKLQDQIYWPWAFQKTGSKLLDYNYCLFLLGLLKQNSKSFQGQINLIYEGTKDGMSFPTVWKKIQGKSNLMWVFQSKSGMIFGVYTPCEWAKLGVYIADEKVNSFIFSQSNKEVFPLRSERKQQTQFFCTSNYLLFGGSCNFDQDIRINPDFNSGYSKLGVGYVATGKDQNYLFGGPEPNIVEFEIYEIH